MSSLTRNLSRHASVSVVEASAEEGEESLYGVCVTRYRGIFANRSVSAFADLNPFFVVRLMRILREMNPDVIHVEFPWGVTAVKAICRLLRKDTLVVYSSQNVQRALQRDLHRYYRSSDHASTQDIIISGIISAHARVVERLALRLSDLVLTVSDDDKLVFIDRYGLDPDKLEVVPNGVDLAKVDKSRRNRSGFGLREDSTVVVFHGSYDYPPNRQAIETIQRYLAPGICEAWPATQIIIAGTGIPNSLTDKYVTALGYVEDIFSLLKSADIAIVPIIMGGGTKLKALDYMGTGLPIVTTPEGIQGISATSGEHVMVVEGVGKEFIAAVVQLIRDPEKRQHLGMNARKLAERQYDWSAIANRLFEKYSCLLEGSHKCE